MMPITSPDSSIREEVLAISGAPTGGGGNGSAKAVSNSLSGVHNAIAPSSICAPTTPGCLSASIDDQLLPPLLQLLEASGSAAVVGGISGADTRGTVGSSAVEELGENTTDLLSLLSPFLSALREAASEIDCKGADQYPVGEGGQADTARVSPQRRAATAAFAVSHILAGAARAAAAPPDHLGPTVVNPVVAGASSPEGSQEGLEAMRASISSAPPYAAAARAVLAEFLDECWWRQPVDSEAQGGATKKPSVSRLSPPASLPSSGHRGPSIRVLNENSTLQEVLLGGLPAAFYLAGPQAATASGHLRAAFRPLLGSVSSRNARVAAAARETIQKLALVFGCTNVRAASDLYEPENMMLPRFPPPRVGWQEHRKTALLGIS